MVNFETGAVNVSDTLSSPCRLRLSISSEIGRSAPDIEDAINSIFSYHYIDISDEGRVIATINDRIEVDQLYEVMDNVSRRIANNKLKDKFMEVSETEEAAMGRSMRVSSNSTNGSIRSVDDRSNARVVLEVTFKDSIDETRFETMMSEHYNRDISIQAMFRYTERDDEKDKAIFVSTLKSIPIDWLLRRLDNFRIDFPVSNMVLTCRPRKEKAGGSLITLGGT